MYILKCPKCQSEIAINDNEKATHDIDCDCGKVITAANYTGQYEYVNTGEAQKCSFQK